MSFKWLLYKFLFYCHTKSFVCFRVRTEDMDDNDPRLDRLKTAISCIKYKLFIILKRL